MAGGTGGHIYPALAVAEHLRARGVAVCWLGSREGLENRLVPKAGYPLATVAVSGLRGHGFADWLMAPFKLSVALAQCVWLLVKLRPAVVLGLGGFASGPGGVAAWLLRRPLVIHEQNARPGLTNRILARLAARVLAAFPGTFPVSARAVFTGNPIRPEIARLAHERREVRRDSLRVLVFGGSRGAHALNKTVPSALAKLSGQVLLEVRHQTGPQDEQAVARAYRDAGIDAEVCAYIDDMPACYQAADLAICRAGAITVAELAAAGLPAVLVPYPHHADDHQTANARYLSDAGAAILIPQHELSADRLAQVVGELARDSARLGLMADAARRLAVPEATARVAGVCLELLE